MSNKENSSENESDLSVTESSSGDDVTDKKTEGGGGSFKTLETALTSFPMIREALDGIQNAHDKECNGEGWLPPQLYKKTMEKASTIVQTSVETTKVITIKTKDTLPKVVQNGLESGVHLADNLGAKSLSIVAEKVPLVGEPGCIAKEKALNTGRKISQGVTSFVAETWLGQKTLGAIDSTLNLTEKPFAYIGNVNLMNKSLDNSIDSRASSSCPKSMRLRVEEKSSHYKLDVYTFGLHGKLVATARYILRKIRRTRRNVRNTKSAGLKVLIKREKVCTRRKLTPKKRIVNISSVGTLGFVADLLQVNSLLKLFGLQIIPSADVRHTRQIIFPPSVTKLVPKNINNSMMDDDETPKRGSVEKIRKRCRKSESSDEGNPSEDHWRDELELEDKEEIEYSDNELANTSLESLDSLEDTSVAALPSNEHDSKSESRIVPSEESNKSKQSDNLENSVDVSETSKPQGHDDSNQEDN